MIWYYKIEYTYKAMSGPEILFPFPYLEFLTPLPLPALNIIHALLLISTLFIGLGIFYRFAISFFFIGFTYFSFVDKTLYNNHFYLMSLIAFVMIFMNADKSFSIRGFFKRDKAPKLIPAWNQYLLMFLIALPYFFGGIAKLHDNWLQSDLCKILINESNIGKTDNFLSNDTLVNFFCYGGLLYDLGIVFLLLFKKTRLLGVGLVLIFNLTNNSFLFNDIGLFPLFMVCSTILFFDSKKLGDFIRKHIIKKESEIKQAKKSQKKSTHSSKVPVQQIVTNPPPFKHKAITTYLIMAFVVFQILFPFRYIFFNDNPEWYSVGSRFSWRMKLKTVAPTDIKMYIKDRKSGQSTDIDFLSFLTSNQKKHIFEDPYQIVHLAKYLGKQAEKRMNFVDPIVTSSITVSFNGLPPQLIIQPDIDLTKVDESPFADNSWIVPLQKKE